MPRRLEQLPFPTRLLYDLGTLSFLCVLLLPLYLLVNQYWKSLLLLVLLYGILGLFFWRLGWHVRRVMQRFPAEIPPWHPAPVTTALDDAYPFGTLETVRNAAKDPVYVQEVLKPRLCHLLAYRLGGSPTTSLEALPAPRLAQVPPAVLTYLQRHEATGVWARYLSRRRRLEELLDVLRHIEAL